MGGLPYVLKVVDNKRFDVAVMIGYLFAVLVITIGIRSYDPENHVAFNPFHEYGMIIRIFRMGFDKGGTLRGLRRLWLYRHVLVTILLNVLLFVPLGYMLPRCVEKIDTWVKAVIIGFLFSLAIESTQLVMKLGWFDASDLLHNTIGAGIGYWIYHRWLKRLSKKEI